ncbi:MAG: hypothetical protein ABI306_07190, partial [Caulobacteraceae bacterium]
MDTVTILLAVSAWYLGAVIYFFAVGWFHPPGNGAAIMMEAAVWPFWTARRIWWALFGPPASGG